MSNPLQTITELLARLAREVDVLPASGQSTVEEAQADTDEREDTRLTSQEHVYDTLWETPDGGGTPPLYVPCPPLSRAEDHLFRYFVDGSFRSYFLGTLLAPQWESPLTFGQVGTCALHRRDDGTVERKLLETEQILMIARYSDVLWDYLQAPNTGTGIILVDILEVDPLTPSDAAADLRDKAVGKIRWRMHLQEANVIKQCLPLLDEDHWLVADGSLRFIPLQEILSNGGQVVPVLGVAKSFRRDVRFRYGRGPRAQDLTLYRLLADLPFAHRTVAFGARDGKFVFWYVRLREQGQVEYPLMGVIKAELINTTGGALPSALINRISRALVAERNVTPHGRDSRWHVHLYPIFLAETALRGCFYSAEVVRSALLWR